MDLRLIFPRLHNNLKDPRILEIQYGQTNILEYFCIWFFDSIHTSQFISKKDNRFHRRNHHILLIKYPSSIIRLQFYPFQRNYLFLWYN